MSRVLVVEDQKPAWLRGCDSTWRRKAIPPKW